RRARPHQRARLLDAIDRRIGERARRQVGRVVAVRAFVELEERLRANARRTERRAGEGEQPHRPRERRAALATSHPGQASVLGGHAGSWSVVSASRARRGGGADGASPGGFIGESGGVRRGDATACATKPPRPRFRATDCARASSGVSEGEAARLGETAEPGRDGVEQLDGRVAAVVAARDEDGAHDRQLADDRGQPTVGLELPEQRPRHLGDRSRQDDDVERAVDDQALGRVGLDHARVHHPRALEVLGGEARELGIDLDRRHVLRLVREQRRHVAGAGADLEDALVALHRELLEQPRLDLRLEHRLAVRQRHLRVDERERAVGGRHEVLALDDREQRQHALVEHIPWADLLLDHVEAGLLDVHGGSTDSARGARTVTFGDARLAAAVAPGTQVAAVGARTTARMERERLADFRGRIVMVGFGSTGQGTLPLLLRHVVDRDRVLVIAPDRADIDAARAEGVSTREIALTQENHRTLLGPELRAGDFVVNLSVGVSSRDLIALCQERGALYLDTSVEPWHGAYTDVSLAPATRTNYALREEALALRRPGARQPTALLTHGANPGLASHFVKQALLDIARDTGEASAAPPGDREGWARLAERL